MLYPLLGAVAVLVVLYLLFLRAHGRRSEGLCVLSTSTQLAVVGVDFCAEPADLSDPSATLPIHVRASNVVMGTNCT